MVAPHLFRFLTLRRDGAIGFGSDTLVVALRNPGDGPSISGQQRDGISLEHDDDRDDFNVASDAERGWRNRSAEQHDTVDGDM